MCVIVIKEKKNETKKKMSQTKIYLKEISRDCAAKLTYTSRMIFKIDTLRVFTLYVGCGVSAKIDKKIFF